MDKQTMTTSKTHCVIESDDVTCVDVLAGDGTNDHYISNRAPLAANPLIKLVPGAIRAGGWLNTWLELERDGMVGHIEEVSHWVQPASNGWLEPEGKTEVPENEQRDIPVPDWLQVEEDRWAPTSHQGRMWSYFRLPYWLRGYGGLGYALNDPQLIRRANVWRHAALEHQQPDGYFGPLTEKDPTDLFPHMIMLNCLEAYHEVSGDDRVLPFMLRFFHFVDSLPEEKLFLPMKEWVRAFGGGLFQNIVWAYNRTGEAWLLKLLEKVHRRTHPWTLGIYGTLASDFELNISPASHCVNIAVGFREPAQYYQLTGDKALLEITENYWRDLRRTYGQFAGGMYASDERCRPGYTDPRQAIETCAIVEFMRSAEVLLGITGDPVWADRCEDVTFNSFPASVMSDFRGLHYLTSPNSVQLDHADKTPTVRNGGCMFSFSPHTRYHCCQHNAGMGWPQFVEHLWYATPDNGIAAVMYGASTLTAKVGDGTHVVVEESTDYPFEEAVRFALATPKPVSFPWMLRIPGWCDNPSLAINGVDVATNLKPCSFAVIRRTWQDGDRVELKLPMAVSLHRWEGNRNSMSVSRGPLTFSLKIDERWEKYTGSEDNQGTDAWPEWQVFADSPWNYALELNVANLLEKFEVTIKPMPNGQVFTPDNAPVEITAPARRVPQWQTSDGMIDVLPESPLISEKPLELVTLIPMGCTRLRITSFPWCDVGRV